MRILDIVGRVMGIIGGIVGILTGLLTFDQKCKPYITQRKGKTEKTHQLASRHLMGRMKIA